MSGIYIPIPGKVEEGTFCQVIVVDGVPKVFTLGSNNIHLEHLTDGIIVPDHSGLFDVGQFEKGCFYGYGHDGKVYKLLWDTKVFDGAKKFYINPIIPADQEEGVE